ncbi:hypothetical protein G7062_06490 [Erysipelothrix sp. HDW6C]|uniref:hypothetical protein n=1 Tax=Erysipelothrix sp. HDW6C TaxID=2714930 RepID=UPI00140B83C0|nr:hypothetical protein [Erysipelothrix sp. HDW6C]QIK69956.1 hypothetical protein G7062_06490 [Erysipelothrix sp. HDW6C]
MLNVSKKLVEAYASQTVKTLRHQASISNRETGEVQIIAAGINLIVEDIGIDGNPIGKFPIGSIRFDLVGDVTHRFSVNGLYDVVITDIYEFDDGENESVVGKRYQITSIEFDKGSKTTTFEGYDIANKLNVEYINIDIEYPTTFKSFVKSFYEFHGIDADLSNLFMSDFLIESKPAYDSGTSALQVARDIGKFALSVQFVNSMNVIKFVRASEITNADSIHNFDGSVKAFQQSGDNFMSLGINTLVLGLITDIDSENVSHSDDLMVSYDGVVELRLDDIPFIWNDDLKREVINTMFDEIKGFKYKAFTLEDKMFMYEIGDTISQSGLAEDNSNSRLVVLGNTTTKQGSIITKYSADSQTVEETENKWSKLSEKRRTEILVNKLDGRIKAIAEKTSIIDELGEKLQEQSGIISLTDSNLQIEIADRIKQGEDLISQTSTLIDQTTESIRLEITKMEENVDGLNEEMSQVKTYFEFSEALTIGKVDSPYKLILGSESMKFMNNNQVQTEISRQQLFTTKVTIRESLNVGNHIIEKSPFDSNRTLWRGVKT